MPGHLHSGVENRASDGSVHAAGPPTAPYSHLPAGLNHRGSTQELVALETHRESPGVALLPAHPRNAMIELPRVRNDHCCCFLGEAVLGNGSHDLLNRRVRRVEFPRCVATLATEAEAIRGLD